MAGWLPDRVRCEHVTFGNVLGPDRKMFKSRSGETVKLASLLGEAIERADAALKERNTDLDDMARTQLAVQIARAAIKYADLSTDRHHDYIFDLDRMIAFEGDTGPYLQYAHARLRSIFRRLGAPWDHAGVAFALDTPQERHLALGSARVPRGVRVVTGRPCNRTGSASTSSISPSASPRSTTPAPCSTSEGALRDQRLALCDLAARTLALGLSVLGHRRPGEDVASLGSPRNLAWVE